MNTQKKQIMPKFNKEILAFFIFSSALLSLELTYTKFFSVVLWYHFGFLIISTAMLGFSAAGIFIFLLKKKLKLSFSKLFQYSGIATLLSYFFMTHIHFTALEAINNPILFYKFFLIIFLLFIPFFFLGYAVIKILNERKKEIGKFYASNLAGSAFGTLVFLFIFNHFDGRIAVSLNVFLIFLATFLLKQSKKEGILSSTLVGITVLTFLFPSIFPMQPPKDKILGLVKNLKKDVVFTGWSSLSKVDFVKNPDTTIYNAIGLWGLSNDYKKTHKTLPQRLGIIIDSWAYTSVLKYPQNLEFYNHMPTTFVYHLGKKFKTSVHIGAGGGLDLLGAKYFGVKDISGVEINPVIVKAIKTKFAKFSGGIYNNKIKGIKIFTDEGRHFVEKADKKFDLIQLSGVDTFSSTQAGAFALSENNLYTTEALILYYKNLKKDGILTMTRWFSPDKKMRPRYSLRLLNIVKEALHKMKIPVKNNLFYFVSAQYTILALKKGDFTKEEIQNGEKYIKNNRFIPLIIPNKHIATKYNIYDKFLFSSQKEYQKLLKNYPYLVSAPTDDKPFFFELRKPSSIFFGKDMPVLPLNVFNGQAILYILLFELIILSIVFIFLPIFILKRRRKDSTPPISQMLYFSLIGLGFMFIEIVLSQKLVLYLGHPTYSLSVVLFSMLLFSGIGSLVSEKITNKENIMMKIFIAILFSLLFLISFVLKSTMNLHFIFRVFITLLLIAPISFFMGMFLPFGTAKSKEQHFPYLWGINGFFSVLSSVLALIISINSGFTTVFVIAFVCYLFAVLIFEFKLK